MLIRLDPRSDKPIYRQIAESVAKAIDTGTFAGGDRLPAARALGGTLDVNMHTVLRAYSELESWGLVQMRRGRGGVVVASGVNVDLLARRLIAAARQQKMSKPELIRVLEEAW